MEQSLKVGIHCKVSYKDEVRRFRFEGTEFSSLKEQIKFIFGLGKNEEFVLKYIDEEGDLITITQNNELIVALGYSQNPNVLKLTVVISTNDPSSKPSIEASAPVPEMAPAVVAIPIDEHHHGEYHNGEHHHGERSKRGGRGGRRGGRCHNPRHEGKMMAKREKHEKKMAKHKVLSKEKLLRRKEKVEGLISHLSHIPANEGNLEFRQKRIEKLQERLVTLNAKIVNAPELEKYDNDDKKKYRRRCSPEQNQKIAAIKDKINNNKEMIYGLKTQIWSKKSEIADNNDEKRKTVLIGELKQLKGQIEDLRDQIREMKHEIHQMIDQ